MNIRIISVGKIKEKYFLDGIKEYKKRLSKFCDVEEVVLNDESIPNNASLAIENIIKEKEGQKIISAISKKSFVIALDLNGKQLDSVEFANKILDIQTYNSSTIDFIIGGSLGLCETVLKKADFNLCFSKMTFPHKLMKLILFEQIYRAFKINNNEKYHK